jgi:autotransporter adhesin
MSKSYKSIGCEKTCTFVAAAETKRAKGKKSSSGVIAAAVVALSGMAGFTVASAGLVASPVQATDGVDAYGKGNAAATGPNATAAGAGSMASGASATAIGSGSAATGLNTTGVGILAQAIAEASVAMGWESSVGIGATRGVAIGGKAAVTGVYGVALGSNAAASAFGSVALGYNAVADRGNSVSVGSATLRRQIINVAAATADTDAVNLAQLKANAQATATALGGGAGFNPNGAVTPPSYSVAGGTETSVGAALSALNVATVQFNGAGSAANVNDHKIVNLIEGVLASGSKDAVNGGQLFTTNSRVGAAEGNIASLDGRVGTAEGDITAIQSSVSNLTTQINSGTVGLVKQDATTEAITVASATGGMSVDFAGTAGERILKGVAEGAIAAGSKDAVNGGQLFTTNSRVDAAEGNIASLDSRVGTAEGDITSIQSSVSNLNTQINSGTVGLVKQDATTEAITVAAATGGTSVDFAGTAGARTLTGVAEGTLDNDAVNVSQLKKAGVIDQNGQALEVATYDPGSNKNSMTLGGADGTQVKNVADGSDDMDAINVRQLRNAGLVDADGNMLDAVTYDAGTSRGVVTFGGAGAPPVLLSNVRAGASNTDAANVGQLRDVAAGLGGGASIDSDGHVSMPVYTVNNVTYSNLGDALAALEGSVGKGGAGTDAPKGEMDGISLGKGSEKAADASGSDSVAIGSGASASGNQSAAVGANASATADNSVALGTGSVATRENTVSVGSVGNERAIANVADGVMETDAVNKRQLDSVATGVRDYTDSRINEVQQSLDSTARNAYSGVAAATALAMIPDVDPGKKFAMGMGVGTFKGYQAAAIGVSARLSERLTVKAGVGSSSAGNTVGAGASFQW